MKKRVLLKKAHVGLYFEKNKSASIAASAAARKKKKLAIVVRFRKDEGPAGGIGLFHGGQAAPLHGEDGNAADVSGRVGVTLPHSVALVAKDNGVQRVHLLEWEKHLDICQCTASTSGARF